MCDDLEKLGCVQNKSYSVKFPSIEVVPLEFVYHFIRGIFDGDGYIGDLKKDTGTGLIYFAFSITGTRDLLEGVQKHINKTNLKLEDKGKFCVLHLAGNAQLKRIFSLLYKDSNPSIELTWKREKVDLLFKQKSK